MIYVLSGSAAQSPLLHKLRFAVFNLQLLIWADNTE